MATQQTFEERRATKRSIASSLAEGFAGVGAVTLALLGLTQTSPAAMLSGATIAAGVAIVFEGGAISSRVSSLLTQASRGTVDSTMIGMGITAEFMGGLAAIALGILSVLGVVPLILVPVAAIVLGTVLVLGSGTTGRLNQLWIQYTEERELVREVTREAVNAATGVHILIGLAAMTLGILALANLAPLILSLVAMLIVGFANLLSGTAISSRVVAIFRR